MRRERNGQDDLERCRAWRDAAVADGWSIEPTYKNEDVNRAASLKRDGFKASVFTRIYVRESGTFYECSVHVWGPDGLACTIPTTYDWPAIVASLRVCNECGASNVDTKRFSFAGRACADCLPAARAEHEKQGWAD